MEKFKDCPFDCGGRISDITIIQEFSDKFFVECKYCGAASESGSTKEHATRNWNTRQTISLERIEQAIIRHKNNCEKGLVRNPNLICSLAIAIKKEIDKP